MSLPRAGIVTAGGKWAISSGPLELSLVIAADGDVRVSAISLPPAPLDEQLAMARAMTRDSVRAQVAANVAGAKGGPM